ncbi:MAG: sensor histidine kinase [Hyphomicrobium sp.]|nr:MAG: sensor histidine kinase [Hyphomicrobium sp.]PPD00348.1 MAG: sensor histidine kinase [Hyphomicrobium sp.]
MLKIARTFSVSQWFGRSVRRQLIAAVGIMLALATLAAGAIAVVNGRKAVDTEMRASIEFAERYLRALVQRISAEGRTEKLEDILSLEAGPLRHAQIYVQRDNSDPKLIEPHSSLRNDHDDTTASPEWFTSVMQPRDVELMRRYIFFSEARASILILGNADDEIAEKWQELSALAVIWFSVIGLLLSGLHALMGRILDPLVALARGLTALEAGQRDQRVHISSVSELAEISQKFNSLAVSLDQARDENGSLYRQMQDVQEEERRQIASELHDEAGPCLFGITANTESIVRLTDNLPANQADQIRKRTSEILTVTERLKSMNRALLRRLRPVSIGKVSISGLTWELLRDFERRHPDVKFVASIETFSRSYGDAIDLTVYRCVQEALTNAIRHGQATSCIVSLEESRIDPEASHNKKPILINLTIRDNGVGVRPGAEIGFGLAAMRERVLSVDGTWTVSENWPAGTMVTVSIPAFDASPTKVNLVQPERIAS